MECLIDKTHIADILQDIKREGTKKAFQQNKHKKLLQKKYKISYNETSLYNTHISENTKPTSQQKTASTYAKHVPFHSLTHSLPIPKKDPNFKIYFLQKL